VDRFCAGIRRDDGMSLHPFQTKSKLAMLTVNNVDTDLPTAAFTTLR
jgi:hypothetical protein